MKNLYSLIPLILLVIGVQLATEFTDTRFYLTQLTMSAYYSIVIIGLCTLMGYAGHDHFAATGKSGHKMRLHQAGDDLDIGAIEHLIQIHLRSLGGLRGPHLCSQIVTVVIDNAVLIHHILAVHGDTFLRCTGSGCCLGGR